MTIKRVEGFNVPFTYPDNGNIKTTSDSSKTITEKPSENSPKQTSQIGELKQKGASRSAELNSELDNVYQHNQTDLGVFKGDIVTIEPSIKE
ncbi:MAG TPA: hypothetical protein VH815_16090 [Acidobacteriota bacterium]